MLELSSIIRDAMSEHKFFLIFKEHPEEFKEFVEYLKALKCIYDTSLATLSLCHTNEEVIKNYFYYRGRSDAVAALVAYLQHLEGKEQKDDST